MSNTKIPEDHRELANLRLLIVEDEEDSRHLLSYLLESCGAKVKLAHSAGDAYQFILNEQFDIIISDICMPKESEMPMTWLLMQRVIFLLFLTQVIMTIRKICSGLEKAVIMVSPG